MKKLLLISAAACLVSAPAFAATKILFFGNNITFGSNSAAQIYRPELIHDLNGPDKQGHTRAGIPSMFKAMTNQAGLDYDVSIETEQNTQFDQHYAKHRAQLDQPWDVVVGNTYTTLSQGHPGDPAELTAMTKTLGDMFYAKNPNVKFYLLSTWARADLTLGSKEEALKHEMQTERNIDHDSAAPWFGKPLTTMGKDMEAGTQVACKAAGPRCAGVVSMALAYNRAVDTGVAVPNPYADSWPKKQIMMYASDYYHASMYMSYLEALMDFGKVTGYDPVTLTKGREDVASEMGISNPDKDALAKVAHDTLVEQGVALKPVVKKSNGGGE